MSSLFPVLLFSTSHLDCFLSGQNKYLSEVSSQRDTGIQCGRTSFDKRAKHIPDFSFKNCSVLPHIQEGKSLSWLTEDDVIFH